MESVHCRGCEPLRRKGMGAVAVAVVVAVAVLAAEATGAAGTEAGDVSACAAHASCGACVLSPACHWCSAQKIQNSRCVHKSLVTTDWCDGQPSLITTALDEIDFGTNVSQIFPIYARVNVRVREKFKINITYRRLEDYPVDLYYLMDLSASMKDDKENLAKLGGALATAMKNVTSNFRLGFGSFVDKVAMPFVNTHPEKLKSPCDDCVPPYSFHNHLSLTDDTNKFTKKVEETPISGNVDFPEGGFDALMQAMVCNKEIMWRPAARHLLVMATDASFHLAGDGKLAGVVEPNDEQCHMENNSYTGGLKYDYPSISQLDRVAHNNSITLIFAVDKTQEKIYNNLISHIRGSDMGTLNKDSSNVIELVLQVYTKLTETVRISDDSMNKGIKVSYRSRCTQASWMDTNACDKIHAKKNITFEVTLEVPSCPPNSGDLWNTTLTLSPNGINERSQLELLVQCGCSCEVKGKAGFERNSSSCSFHGDKKCGVCHCYDAYTGQMCECEKDQVTKKESDDQCITNNATRQICNDRGSCVCNVCRCTKRQNPEEVVSGSLCECDNFSCLRWGGSVCGGAERGTCTCGECVCQPGWTGDDCSCPDGPGVCRAPHDDSECSGAGRCECGKCVCAQGITGQFCEDCTGCTGGRCKTLAKCVEYLVHKTGTYNETLCLPQNITIHEIVKGKIKENEDDVKKEIRRCKVPDEPGCSFVFTYQTKDERIIIIAEEEKECPTPVDLLGIVFGVIGGTVLIGLVSIFIWKLLTSIHDKREFAKFEQERSQAKWGRDNNPIYKPSTSTYSNPTFSTGN